MKLKLILTLITVFCFAGTQAQTADEILAKYFSITGGLGNWRALKSRTMVGKAFYGPQELAMSVYEKTPNKQKTVINFQGMEMVINAYDGKDAWMLNPMQGGKDPMKMDDEQSKELREELFESDFIDYKKKGHEVTLEGSEDVDGMKCYKIKMVRNKNNPQEDITELFYFDSENAVLIMKSSLVRSGPQKGTEVKSYVSDYQDVSGLMFPFAIEQRINGQSISRIAFEKITINDITDDSIFAFPKK